MTSKTPETEPNTIRAILLEVLTFGYDTGQGLDNQRGFNINDAEAAMTKVLGGLVEAEWQTRAKPVIENHKRLAKKLDAVEQSHTTALEAAKREALETEDRFILGKLVAAPNHAGLKEELIELLDRRLSHPNQPKQVGGEDAGDVKQ